MDGRSETEQFALTFEQHEEQHLRSLLEAVLFAAPEPVTVRQLARATEEPEERIAQLLGRIAADFEAAERGIFVHRVGSGYRFGTKPHHHEALRDLLRDLRPRPPLSAPALQTLAIIAYKQPISAGEIQTIRGVEGAGVLETLRKRKLIAPAGRNPRGRHALLYKTTETFLQEFGFLTLGDLPLVETFGEAAVRGIRQG